MEELIKKIYTQAKLIGACDLFTGKEKTLDEIISLFTSPQGIEFCLKNHFPNLATFRQFKPYNLVKYGIYMDAGTISLHNPKHAILIGRTSATIECDTTELHTVTMLHGAKAIVNAKKWTVVATNVESGCNIIKTTSDNAVIL